MELVPMASVDETILEMMMGILVRDPDGWERIQTIIELLEKRDEALSERRGLMLLQ